LAFDFPFRPVEDQRGKGSRNQLIPPVVYQTWEENSFGRRHRKSMEKFRSQNADLSFILFDRNLRDEYLEKTWGNHPIFEVYSRAKLGPMKADIFRYCILFERGGYYFDISKGFDGAITSYHPSHASGFISFENNRIEPESNTAELMLNGNLVIQWGLGFASEHPVLRNVIDSIAKNAPLYFNVIVENPKRATLELTGPIAMTRAVWNSSIKSIRDLHQMGIDFDGHGIYAMKGAGARHLRFPSYAHLANESIFS
jgi:mannosyltransferase OCH1-like enzyme